MPTAIIRPGTLQSSGNVSLIAGASYVAALDPGPSLSHDGDTTTAGRLASVGDPTFLIYFKPLLASLPTLVEKVNSLTTVVRGRRSTTLPGAAVNLRAYTELGGVGQYNTYQAMSGGGTYADYSYPLTRPGAGDWTLADLQASTFYFGFHFDIANDGNQGDAVYTSLWMLLDYREGGKAVESFREAGTRRLRLRRLPGGLIRAELPTLEYLDHELLDLMAISHPELPGGAGIQPWERWPVLKMSSEPNWNNGTETVLLRDLRPYIVRHWDMAKAQQVAIAGGVAHVARLGVGGTRTWVRASNAWVYRSDRRIVLVGYDQEKLDSDGALYESATTNEIIESCFKNGTFTGWTSSGTGSNGSAIGADANDTLFRSADDGSAQSVKMTAGNPIHVADLQLQGTATASVLANTVCRAAIWHKDDSGFSGYYAIQRAVDSKWWRDSDQAWQAAKTWNAMTLSSASVPARHRTKQMDVGTSATTLTFLVGIPTTGQPGQVNHFYAVQLEKKRYSTSQVATELSTYTRVADKFTVSNNAIAPSWPPLCGSFRCKARPWWDTGDLVAGEFRTLAYVRHDADNYEWVYYDATAGALKFERRAGGVTYATSKTITLTAFTNYNVVARWTSSAGELGLAAYTLSVFVWEDGASPTGAKGTDATAAALTIANTCDLEIGSRQGADHWDGNIWAQEVTQQALTDNAAVRY